MLRRFVVPALLATALMLPGALGTARASQQSDGYIERLDQAGTQVIERFRRQVFLDRIRYEQPDWLKLYNSINVFLTDDMSIGAFASIKNGKRSISISRRLFIALDLYAQYAAIRMTYPNASAACKKYLDYLGAELRNNDAKSLKSFMETVDPPNVSCEVNPTGNAAYQKAYQTVFNETFAPVIGLMLGHEYGHHLLGHLPARKMSPVEAREIESEADTFGSKLLGPGFLRGPIAVIFDLIARGRNSDPFLKTARHEAAECRFIYFMADDMRHLNENAARRVIAYLRSRPDIAERLPSIIETALTLDPQYPTALKCKNFL